MFGYVIVTIDIYHPEELNDQLEVKSLIIAREIHTPSSVQRDELPSLLQAIVSELLDLHNNHLNISSLRRELHIRHVTIYVSNVALGISMRQLAKMFNLNRSTIAYACRTIEERRDNPDYDRFIEATERMVLLFASNIKQA